MEIKMPEPLDPENPASFQKKHWYESKALDVVLVVLIVAVITVVVYLRLAIPPDIDVSVPSQNGSEAVLYPEVKTPLGKYSPFMSSVPGYPFLIRLPNGPDTEQIRVTVDHGTLLTWDAGTGYIEDKGKSYICTDGATVYWSPIAGSTAYVENAQIDVYSVHFPQKTVIIHIHSTKDLEYSAEIISQ